MPVNPAATFDILLLAAGESKRMTGIKQLLPVDNSTFIELTIQKGLQLQPRHLVVVLGAYLDKIAPVIQQYPVTIVENADWKTGMSSSIAAGVNFIGDKFGHADGLLILLCDQIRLIQAKTFLVQLLAQWRKNPRQVVATSHGDKLGVPALFPANFTSNLKSLDGDKGAREFLNSGQYSVLGIDSRGLGVDVNTDEEYARLTL